jgi:hypothetical protein
MDFACCFALDLLFLVVLMVQEIVLGVFKLWLLYFGCRTRHRDGPKNNSLNSGKGTDF